MTDTTDRRADVASPTVPPALAGRAAEAVIRGLDLLEAARALVWDMEQLEAAAGVLSDTGDTAHEAMWEASGTSDLRALIAAIATVATDPTGVGGAVPGHEQVRRLRARYEPGADQWAGVVAARDGLTASDTSEHGRMVADQVRADLPQGGAGEAPLTVPGELERTVRELRADLEHLRRELASEVRTRRVVVVEADGFERVVLNGHQAPTSLWPSNAGVHVFGRTQHRPVGDCDTSVSLFAVEDEAYDGQEDVGVRLRGAGDDYADLILTRDEVRNESLDLPEERYRAELGLHTPTGQAAFVVRSW